MKLILKEKKKSLKEDVNRPDTFRMKASDFLGLTTDAKLYASIKKNVKNPKYFDGEPFNRAKVGKLFLLVDKTGKVVGHEGRHRSMAAIQAEGSDAEMIVDIASKDYEYFPIPEVLSGQFNPSFKVQLDPENWVETTEENILNLGIYGTQFINQREFMNFLYGRLEDSGMDSDKFAELVRNKYRIDDNYGDVYLGYDDQGFYLTNAEEKEPDGKIYVKPIK